MTDIEKAKEMLINGDYSCVLCRGNAVFASKERGIKPLVELCRSGENLNGFSAADKIVGKAAAFLYAYMGVREVHAQTMSRGGEQVLKTYSIKYSCDTLCDEIINRKGTDVCPMEKAVRDIDNFTDAYKVLCGAVDDLDNRIH